MFTILLLPIISGVSAQAIKLLIKINKEKINLKDLIEYSGMPSGHSSITVSLTTIIGLKEGFDSALFAACFVFTMIILRDALGMRRYLGQHGKILNLLITDLKEDKFLDQEYAKLKEGIGHTPIQVLAGSLLGFLISVLGFIILK